MPPKEQYKLYNVRPGDTLTAIASAADITLADLLSINLQIQNPDLIYSGHQILLPGTVDLSALNLNLAVSAYPDDDWPNWYKIAKKEEAAGIAEIKPRGNPRILEYLQTCNLTDEQKSTDDTAWCAAFVNWCYAAAGIKGKNSARALKWLEWGVKDENPSLGSLAIWKRVVYEDGKVKDSGGHVAFLESETNERLKVLGGNQEDKVCTLDYPRNGFRKLSESRENGTEYTFQGYRKPPA
ncbi:MAG: LysM peptidoglycan-binding domain-containing protein [Rhodospirillaceae bacterium]|nr:LysM peptidoglycan-binding domain-containing protein [Rhodospirillaceae bacterium]